MRELWRADSCKQYRKGTSIIEIKNIFQNNITVKSIEEPLLCCDIQYNLAEVINIMEKENYDIIGVKNEEKVIGYINKNQLLYNDIENNIIKFSLNDIISNSTSLFDTVNILGRVERLFILNTNEVTSIVTRADLQKPPVRLIIFSYISLFEMHLNYLIRQYLDIETIHNKISKERLQKAKELYLLRKERNEEIDIYDCLQICDKKELIIKNDNIIKILKTSKCELKNNMKKIEKLRNKISHSQDIVEGSSWEEIIMIIKVLEQYIECSEDYIRESR